MKCYKRCNNHQNNRQIVKLKGKYIEDFETSIDTEPDFRKTEIYRLFNEANFWFVGTKNAIQKLIFK